LQLHPCHSSAALSAFWTAAAAGVAAADAAAALLQQNYAVAHLVLSGTPCGSGRLK
jgi:hypothetical protein